MPIYDFKCQQCGGVTEIFVRSADHAVSCPHCGGNTMERLMSSSYMIRTDVPASGTTCCGKTERCETPPCSTGDICRRR